MSFESKLQTDLQLYCW